MRVAIVNRSFWPRSSVIGEGLLQLAEQLEKNGHQAIVITQVEKGFSERLQKEERGTGVKFSTLRSMTTSASPIFLRILELILFTVFVFFSLCWHRPDKVYVATNPPIFVPMAVRWYCRLFKRKYLYHLQDIHPEATEVVTGKKGLLSRVLKNIDSKTINQAETVITLTEQMKAYILRRTEKEQLPIVLLDNASVENKKPAENKERIKGFVYCGNAGRLQRIPLLIESIRAYIKQGGTLPFVFAGGGIYRKQLEALAAEFEQVTHLGVLPGGEAAELLQQYTYGLMPIEDEVTNYAFPSKSSSYVFSGCATIAICGPNTSVARWVDENGFGYVVEPQIEHVVGLFRKLESHEIHSPIPGERFVERLTIGSHVVGLKSLLLA